MRLIYNFDLYTMLISQISKRGIKHFITRIAVSKGNLFVLTAQVKEVDFTEYEKEMEETVKTFHVV